MRPARLRIAASTISPDASVETPAVRDLEGLAADTVRGAALGFVGRTAAHPRQLPVIVEAFRPTPEQVSWAEAVIAALGSTAGVSTLASGEMVDAAMRSRAGRILALQRATA